MKNEKSNYELNAFAQTDYKYNKYFSGIAGLRATHNSNYGLNFVPKLTLMAKVTTSTFRLSYGWGFRSPSLKELYFDFDHLEMFTIHGNSNLRPEKSQYIGFSYDFDKPRFSSSVNLYYNRLNDLIVYRWLDSKNIYYTNDSVATVAGLDLMERVMPIKNLILSLGLSLVDAINRTSGKQLYNISPVSANVGISYFILFGKNRTSFDFYGKYNGRRVYEPLDNFQQIDMPYNIWKFSITQSYQSNLHFTLGIDNVFSQVNSRSYDNISPGRRIFVALSYNFTKY